MVLGQEMLHLLQCLDTNGRVAKNITWIATSLSTSYHSVALNLILLHEVSWTMGIDTLL